METDISFLMSTNQLALMTSDLGGKVLDYYLPENIFIHLAEMMTCLKRCICFPTHFFYSTLDIIVLIVVFGKLFLCPKSNVYL